jgi:tetratricopeptide (TPR) repeat protein
MSRKRVFLLLGLLCAVFFVNICISSLRDRSIANKTPRYDPAEHAPLLLLGSLRGIAVDLLWIRAIARHEEKKYYELLTINNLIAKLQPNFSSVWIFQAWNMAYNIAHEWDAPQNKWKWIHAGLDFGKRGALKNPNSSDLLFELGYMYLHLFDQRFFKYADYYRKQLKREDGEDNYEASLYWLRKALSNTPKSYNTLAIERTVCHVLKYASVHAEKEGDFDKALEYTESAIYEWEMYRANHPEDTVINVDDFISKLEERKEFLQTLVNIERRKI